MAKFAMTDTDIYVGALDAACFGNSLTLDATVDVVDATTWCSGGWRVLVPSLRSWTLETMGPQDLVGGSAQSATYAPDELYALTVGTDYPLAIVPQGAAVGQVAYLSTGALRQYTPVQGQVGALGEHVANFMLRTYPLVRGIYAVSQTVTATGNGTGQLLGAVAAGQYVYAGVHFLTAGGTTPSMTVVLESDDNAGFTSPTTRATFTAQTARGAQFTRVAGAITDTYWRMRWTVTGTTPSFQTRGFIGIQ